MSFVIYQSISARVFTKFCSVAVSSCFGVMIFVTLILLVFRVKGHLLRLVNYFNYVGFFCRYKTE